MFDVCAQGFTLEKRDFSLSQVHPCRGSGLVFSALVFFRQLHNILHNLLVSWKFSHSSLNWKASRKTSLCLAQELHSFQAIMFKSRNTPLFP